MRKFHISVILSVITGRLLCDMSDLYDILDYMTGDENYTHQLPRAGDECTPYLEEAFPFLKELEKEAESHDDDWWHAHYQDFANEAAKKFGAEHDVRPIHPEDHAIIDPIEELQQMSPGTPIITIQDKPEDDIPPEGNINWKN